MISTTSSEGSLDIVSNDHLYRRMSCAGGSGNAWAEAGEACVPADSGRARAALTGLGGFINV